MARQLHKALSFDIPEGWEDRTLTAFAAPVRPGKTAQPNVVITQEALPGGQSLRTYATRQLTTLAKGLPEFELEETRDANIAGHPAIDVRFTWQGDKGPLVQRQLMLAHRDVVYNITLSTPRADAAAMASLFDGIVTSLSIPGASIAPAAHLAPTAPPPRAYPSERPVKW